MKIRLVECKINETKQNVNYSILKSQDKTAAPRSQETKLI